MADELKQADTVAEQNLVIIDELVDQHGEQTAAQMLSKIDDRQEEP